MACFSERRVRHRIAWKRLSVISDPSSVREIFVNNPQAFRLCNLHLRLLRPSLGEGLIVAQGEDWRRLRRASLAFLSQVKRQSPELSQREAVKSAVANLVEAHGRSADFPLHLSRLVLDLLAINVLGHSRTIASMAITEAIERHREVSERVDLLDVLGLTPGITSNRMRRAKAVASSFDARILDEVAHRGEPSLPRVDASEHRDLIVNLLTGFESVWLSCLWSLLVLGHQPELAEWVGLKRKSPLDRNRLFAVMREVLRLYPPLPFIYREPLHDLDLPIGPVRKGEMICVAPYVVHRHHALWRDPDVFDPRRPASDYDDFPYMPFGIGARRCVGASAGPQLALSILESLLEAHRPVVGGAFPVPRGGMSLRPSGNWQLTVEPR